MIKEVERYVRKQMNQFAKDAATLETGSSKARLAKLRRGIGKKPGELPELWGMFLQGMPEELMSKSGEPSYAEWAIYTALTLFALHQQGHSEPMNAEGSEYHLGQAVRKLAPNRDDEDDEAKNIMLKFSIAAGSDDMVELSYRMKMIVILLGNGDVKLDYVDFAKDLFLFQFEASRDKVRLKWGQDFYRIKTDDNRKEENDDKE